MPWITFIRITAVFHLTTLLECNGQITHRKDTIICHFLRFLDIKKTLVPHSDLFAISHYSQLHVHFRTLKK
jgi:hypothetical protein